MKGIPVVKLFVTALPSLLRDLSGIAGCALVSYGAWRAYEPAGFIVGGVLLASAAFLSARASS
jgi:hypothetical protein